MRKKQLVVIFKYYLIATFLRKIIIMGMSFERLVIKQAVVSSSNTLIENLERTDSER